MLRSISAEKNILSQGLKALYLKKLSMLSKDQHCLEAIIEAIDRIIEYTSNFKSADDFNNDHVNFDATMMNFVVIGEMVDKLSEGFKKQNSQVEWIKIKGFRNIVAHDYFGIDAEEVWQIIKNKIPYLKIEISNLLS
jgi:uncharacterized protein with HEPN domain